MDAPHGIVDVFVHGVSLAQVAHRVDAAGKLEVLPSGPVALRPRRGAHEPALGAARRGIPGGGLASCSSWRRRTSRRSRRSCRSSTASCSSGASQPWPGVRVLAPREGGPGSGSYGALAGRPTPAYTPAPRRSRRRRVRAPPHAGAPRRARRAAHHGAPAAARRRRSLAALRAPSRPGCCSPASAPLAVARRATHAAPARRRHRGLRPAPPASRADSSSHGAPPRPPPIPTRRAAAWTVEIGGYTSVTAANARLDRTPCCGLPALTWSPGDGSRRRT